MERKWGGSERHCMGEQESIFSVLKVPRQCSLVCLVKVVYMIGIDFII
jgi:hypothetical protein